MPMMRFPFARAPVAVPNDGLSLADDAAMTA